MPARRSAAPSNPRDAPGSAFGHKLAAPLPLLKYVAMHMVLQKAQFRGPSFWGFLVAMAVANRPATFNQLYCWLSEKLGAEISESSLRSVIRSIVDEGYATELTAVEISGKRGPSGRVYEITELGVAALEAAPNIPILRQA